VLSAPDGIQVDLRANAGDQDGVVTRVPSAPAAPLSDFAPLADTSGQRRAAATGWALSQAGSSPASGDAPGDERSPSMHAPLVGTLVHRLLAAHWRPDDDEASLLHRALAYLAGSDDAAGADLDALAAEAVALATAFRRRTELATLLDGAVCHFEVPFSLRIAGEAPAGAVAESLVVSGSIDCLATIPDGRVLVVELKTGRARPWHRVQLETYVRAARALCPGKPVEGHLVYADLHATGTGERASNQVGAPNAEP